MKREIFSEEHDLFRREVRRFIEAEVKPYQERWAEAGIVDREAWRKAGAAGLLCPDLPPEYGGASADFLYSVVINEEMARAGESGFAIGLHSDIIVSYISAFGTEEQKRRWLPGCARGDIVTALAMTEPGAGSDLAAIRTTTIRDGGSYVLNGAKTFISNGILCDLVIVAAKTDPAADPPHAGVSLVVVEAGTPGFVKGKKLKQMGMFSQDTSELFFEDCRVPAGNLLGEEGQGFYMLMRKLQQERLVVAIGACAMAEKVVEETVEYCKTRQAFGKPLSKLQNTQFKLVEAATRAAVARAFVDRVIAAHVRGEDLVTECSMAKWWVTDTACQIVDECLQLFGGYGYMLEYPVARAFMDARVQKIYAGTNEIMKVIIAKRMGL